MNEVYVVGVGITCFGRRLDQTVKTLTREAVSLALRDCGIAADQIDAAFFANATQSPLEGQHMISGQIALREIGFEGTAISNVENACASAGTAFHLACTHVKAGVGDLALAIGVDRMCFDDKTKTFAVLDGAWDIETRDETAAALESLAASPNQPETVDMKGARSPFMDVYASLARFHMKTYGTTIRQMAAVASKNHAHAVHNSNAQYRVSMSIADVLEARTVIWPLTIPMCAPISDGAAAAVVCNRDGLARLSRLGFDMSRAVRVMATVIGGGTNRSPEDLSRHICRLAADRAYAQAGIGPSDISLAEIHDASAFAEIQQAENMGFCELGQGGWIAERGDTTIGSRIPINPSGGLECKGHPIGATGLAQIHELVVQLRHEAGARQVERARFGIGENAGGFYRHEDAVACISILGRHGA